MCVISYLLHSESLGDAWRCSLRVPRNCRAVDRVPTRKTWGRRVGDGGPQRVEPLPLCFSRLGVPSSCGPRWATARRAVGPLFSAVLRAVPVWATVGHGILKHEIAPRATSSPRPGRWVVASPSFYYVWQIAHLLRPLPCAWPTVGHDPQLKMYYNTRDESSAAHPCRKWATSPCARLPSGAATVGSTTSKQAKDKHACKHNLNCLSKSPCIG